VQRPPRPVSPRPLPLRNPLLGNPATQTPGRGALGRYARGQEENSCGSEGVRGPSRARRRPADPSPPRRRPRPGPSSPRTLPPPALRAPRPLFLGILPEVGEGSPGGRKEARRGNLRSDPSVKAPEALEPPQGHQADTEKERCVGSEFTAARGAWMATFTWRLEAQVRNILNVI
jgi:hypothetical protein